MIILTVEITELRDGSIMLDAYGKTVAQSTPSEVSKANEIAVFLHERLKSQGRTVLDSGMNPQN